MSDAIIIVFSFNPLNDASTTLEAVAASSFACLFRLLERK